MLAAPANFFYNKTPSHNNTHLKQLLFSVHCGSYVHSRRRTLVSADRVCDEERPEAAKGSSEVSPPNMCTFSHRERREGLCVCSAPVSYLSCHVLSERCSREAVKTRAILRVFFAFVFRQVWVLFAWPYIMLKFWKTQGK